jgi:hypothetical protein
LLQLGFLPCGGLDIASRVPSAYDVNAPTNAMLLNAEFGHPTPDWQPMGYRGVFTNLPGASSISTMLRISYWLLEQNMECQ